MSASESFTFFSSTDGFCGMLLPLYWLSGAIGASVDTYDV